MTLAERLSQILGVEVPEGEWLVHPELGCFVVREDLLHVDGKLGPVLAEALARALVAVNGGPLTQPLEPLGEMEQGPWGSKR